MDRANAIEIIEEIFGEDRYGIRDTLTDEQIEAIQIALHSLKAPECMSCGYCQELADEDSDGWGWCKQHDRAAHCNDEPCLSYEKGDIHEKQNNC